MVVGGIKKTFFSKVVSWFTLIAMIVSGFAPALVVPSVALAEEDIYPPSISYSELWYSYGRYQLSIYDDSAGVVTTYYRWDDQPWLSTTELSINRYKPAGSHTLSFYAVDETGNASEIQTQATSMTGQTGISINYPRSGSTVFMSNFEVGGATMENSTVQVYSDGQPVGTSNGVSGGGDWRNMLSGQGTMTITARAVHESGYIVGETAPVTFTVNTNTDYSNWHTLGSMTVARGGHTSIGLADGRLLLVGGDPYIQYPYLNTAEIFNPNTGMSVSLGTLPDAARVSYGEGVLLADGRAMIGAGDRAIIFNPQTMMWESSVMFPQDHNAKELVLLDSGLVLGVGCGVANATQAFVYDPTSNACVYIEAPSVSRSESFRSVKLQDGRVAVLGGDSTGIIEIFDPEALGNPFDINNPGNGQSVWTIAGSMTVSRYMCGASLMNDGKIFIAGGFGPGSGVMGLLDTAEIFDTATGYSTPVAPMHIFRACINQFVFTLNDGRVLVMNNDMNPSSEVYDPVTNSWTVPEPFKTPRIQVHGVQLANGSVLATGGGMPQGGTITPQTVEIYGAGPVPGDINDPISWISINPSIPTGQNGWFISPPEITLSGWDEIGGSGLKEIRYNWDSPVPAAFNMGGIILPGGQLYTGPITPPEGSHTLYFRAEDNAGNIEEMHQGVPGFDMGMLKVDSFAPFAPSFWGSESLEGSTVENPVWLSGFAGGLFDTVRLYDNGQFLSETYTFPYDMQYAVENFWNAGSFDLSPGPHTLTAIEKDLAGNTSPPVDLHINIAAPVALATPKIWEPIDGASYNGPFAVSGSADPNITVSLFDGLSQIGSTICDLSGNWRIEDLNLISGPHSLTAQATDSLGNSSDLCSPISITVEVDEEPPLASITNLQPNMTAGARGDVIPVTVDASDKVGVTKVELWDVGNNLKLAESTTAPWTCNWTPTAIGSYRLVAKAYDAAGNVGTSEEIYNSFVSGKLTMTNPTSGTKGGRFTPITASCSDLITDMRPSLYVDGVYVTYQYLNSPSFNVSFPYSWDTNQYTDGSTHTIEIRTYTGSWITTTAKSTITVDNSVDVTSPLASITNLQPNMTAGARGDVIPVTVDASDKVGVTKVELWDVGNNLKLAESTTAPWTCNWTPTAIGSYRLVAKAYDAAGNVGTSEEIYNSFVSGKLTMTNPTSGTKGGRFTPITASCSDLITDMRPSLYVDGVYVTYQYLNSPSFNVSFPYSWDTNQYTDGSTHTIEIRTYTGSWITTTAKSTITVDNSVDVTSPLASITNLQPNMTAGARGDVIPVTVDASDKVGVTKVELWDVGNNLKLAESTTAPWTCNWTPTAIGSYRLVAKAYDAAGNVGTSEEIYNSFVSGKLTMTNPTSGTKGGRFTPITASCSDLITDMRPSLYVDGVYVTYQYLNSPSFNVSFPYSWDTNQYTDGSTHTIEIRTYTGSWITTTAKSTITVDNSVMPDPPVIISPVNQSQMNTSVVFGGTSQPNMSIELFEAGSVIGNTVADSTGAWAVPAMNLAEGSHTVYAKAIGDSGKTSVESPAVYITVDYTKPNQPEIILPLDGSFTNQPVYVDGTAEPNSTIVVFRNGVTSGTALTSDIGVWHYGPLEPVSGAWSITAKAIDLASNESAISDVTTINIDTESPSAPILIRPIDGLVTNTSVTVSGMSEPGASIELFENGAYSGQTVAAPDGFWTFPASLPSDGKHAYIAIATDKANNESESSSSVSVEVDTIAPTGLTSNSTSHAEGIWSYDNAIDISWAGTSDTGSGVVGYSYIWSNDQGTIPDGIVDVNTATNGLDSQILSDGIWYFHIIAIDKAGNKSEPSHAGPYMIDTSPAPVTTLQTNPSAQNNTNGWFSCAPMLTLQRDKDGSTYYQWDSSTGPWTLYSSQIPALEGQHVLYFYSKNAAERPEEVKNYSTSVDTIVPLNPWLESSSHTTGKWSNDNTIDVTLLNASDIGSGVSGYSIEWSNDPNTEPDTIQDIASSQSTICSSVLTDGEWYFHLKTVDNAGNWAAPVHIGPFKIDTVAPSTDSTISPITPDGQAGWYKTSPSAALTVDQEAKTYYQWDGPDGAWNEYLGSVSFPNGTHRLFYYSEDAAGNKEAVNSTDPVMVDNTAPIVGITSPSAGSPVSGVVTINAAASDPDGSGITKVILYINGTPCPEFTTPPYKVTWDTTKEIDGPSSIRVEAVDAQGNIASSSLTEVHVSNQIISPSAIYIKDWLVLGPFTNNNSATRLTKDYLSPAGETNIDPILGKTNSGKTWKLVRSSTPYINLSNAFSNPVNCASYASTYVYSPTETQATLKVGSDDGFAIWVNGTLRKMQSVASQPYVVDQYRVDATLKKGLNKIVIKVANSVSAYGYSVKIGDAYGSELPGLTFQTGFSGTPAFFQDNFQATSKTLLPIWGALSGTGQIEADAPNTRYFLSLQSGSILSKEKLPSADFVYNADLAYQADYTGNWSGCLLFRATDYLNCYYIKFGKDGSISLYRKKNGVSKQIGPTTPYEFSANANYHVQVICQGANITAMVNETCVMNIVDAENTFPNAGKIGFSTGDTSQHIHYDNVTVSPISVVSGTTTVSGTVSEQDGGEAIVGQGINTWSANGIDREGATKTGEVINSSVSQDASSGAPASAAITASDGSYSVVLTEPATYTVSTDIPGYTCQDKQIAVAPTQTLSIDKKGISAMATTASCSLDFQETAQGSVSGLVTDINGQPIANAQISIFSESNANSGKNAATDASGNFLIPDTDAVAGYFATVDAEGYSTSGSGLFDVLPNQTANIGVLVLSPAGIISGIVSDAFGNPMGNVNVTATQSGNDMATRSTLTASDGTYTIRDLDAPGEFSVSAIDAQIDSPIPQAVAVTSGKNTSGINFVMGLAPSFSAGWWNEDATADTHGWIVRRALQILKSDKSRSYKDYIAINPAKGEEYWLTVIRGVRAADLGLSGSGFGYPIYLMDLEQHFHDPYTHKGLYGASSAATNAKIHFGNAFYYGYNNWKGPTDLNLGMYYLGVSLHHLQDSCNPFHTAMIPHGYPLATGVNKVAGEYEDWVNATRKHQITKTSGGFYPSQSKLYGINGQWFYVCNIFDWVDLDAHCSRPLFDVFKKGKPYFTQVEEDPLMWALEDTAGMLFFYELHGHMGW